VDLLYFILCAYGLTQIIVYGTIFDRIRPQQAVLGGLFHCPMCMGFWIGIFLFGINDLTELFSFDYNYINAFLLGCLSSGTSYAFNMIFGDNGVKHEHLITRSEEKVDTATSKTLLQG
jgi:hypothetical protein